MQIQQDFVEVKGIRLYCEMAGSEQPLVLIHGFSLDHRIWADQFEWFAQAYRVIRYDLRGLANPPCPTASPIPTRTI